MNLFRLLSFLILICVAPASLAARDIRVAIGKEHNIDEVGAALRRAINAYETAMVDPRPTSWTRVSLRQGDTYSLGREQFLVMLPVREQGDIQLMYVDQNGPQTGSIRGGAESQVGPLRVILVTPSSSGRQGEFLIKTAEEPARLADEPPGTSSTRIQVYDRPKEVVVTSHNGAILDFAQKFLRELNAGRAPEQASAAAFEHAPPVRSAPVGSTAQLSYTDPRNFGLEDEDEGSFGAGVTLHLVRADSETLNALATDLAYDSEGRADGSPRVQVESGEEGGTVTLGDPGDRFRARLRILEREGKANVDGETYLRVPFDDMGSEFSLISGNRTLYATMTAQRAGRNGARLHVDNEQGDWGMLSSIRSGIRLNDGQTVLLAKSAYSRTEESSSQVPILGDIPYIGPIFGRESRRTVGSDYALFATLSLE